MVFLAFIFFILSCCIFFEFGIPDCLSRHLDDDNDSDDDCEKHEHSPIETANDQHENDTQNAGKDINFQTRTNSF